MIDLYFWPTPNGHKVTLMLEEAGMAYTIKPVNITKGEQLAPAFIALSPNNRMPAIVDHDPQDGDQPGGGGPLSIFESGAILLYLAKKAKAFAGDTCASGSRSRSGCSGRSAASGRWRGR